MSTLLEQDTQQLKTKIIMWAHEIETWNIEWRTGIYPGEMAAFLGMCDLYKIRSIIESGRGEDAYSTYVLGEYAERAGIEVVSADYQPIEEKKALGALRRYRHLNFLAGDIFNLFPSAIKNLQPPVALLLDGPKFQLANRLSFVASMMFDIQVLAHHNCFLSSVWGQEFSGLFPGAFHYEELNLSVMPEWQGFKRWEFDWTHGYEQFDKEHNVMGRSLKASSLALAHIPQKRSLGSVIRFQRRLLNLNHLKLWTKWFILNRDPAAPSRIGKK